MLALAGCGSSGSTTKTPASVLVVNDESRVRGSRARSAVLHPGRVEGCPPALLVILGELEIVALAGHADRYVPDARPRVEPGAAPGERGPTMVWEARRTLVLLAGADAVGRAHATR